MICSITGSHGFIGSALSKRIRDMGGTVFTMPRPDIEYLFLFGSPSSDHWFTHALSYSLRETIGNFINAIDYCKEHKIKLIYPSSGTVYAGNTPYSKCKGILDEIASCYGSGILGCRIFAGYGQGELHKNEYASVVYQFARSISWCNAPVVYGDGTQTRDFIYIDDIVTAILDHKDEDGFVDIGTGVNTSFNKLIEIFSKQVGKIINPEYKPIPDRYIHKTECLNPCKFTVSVEEGVKKVLEEL